jgi:hypothetical protein
MVSGTGAGTEVGQTTSCQKFLEEKKISGDGRWGGNCGVIQNHS